MGFQDLFLESKLDVYYITIFSIFGLAVLGAHIFWKTIKHKFGLKKDAEMRFFLVPMIISVSLVFIFLQKMSWDIQSMKLSTERSIEKIIDIKWGIVDNFLEEAAKENSELSKSISLEIINELKDLPAEKIDYYLDNIGLIQNNKVQEVVGDKLKGKYFRNVISDANDPFAMIIGKGEGDSFIFADFSENCSIEELTRNLNQEYELQGKEGDKELAKYAFNKILALHTGEPLEDIMFFRFAKKDGGVPLIDYTYKGIKKTFFENKGDFHSTFQSLEFLAPYYIYRNESLSGEPRISGRIRTDAKIITIVSVFSLEEIIKNNKYISENLNEYDNLQSYLIKETLREERTSLIVGILVMMITLTMFILFWFYLHHNSMRKEACE